MTKKYSSGLQRALETIANTIYNSEEYYHSDIKYHILQVNPNKPAPLFVFDVDIFKNDDTSCLEMVKRLTIIRHLQFKEKDDALLSLWEYEETIIKLMKNLNSEFVELKYIETLPIFEFTSGKNQNKQDNIRSEYSTYALPVSFRLRYTLDQL